MTNQRPTPDELEAEIAVQRAELADTVDQLAHKLDVKAQAKAKLSQLGPQQVAVAVGAVLAVGVLVWWRRGR